MCSRLIACVFPRVLEYTTHMYVSITSYIVLCVCIKSMCSSAHVRVIVIAERSGNLLNLI